LLSLCGDDGSTCVNIIQNLIQYYSGTVNTIHDEVIGDHPCGLCFHMSMKCQYMAVDKYNMPATVFADFKKTSGENSRMWGSVLFLSLQSELWCVLQLIIPSAEKFELFICFLDAKNISALEIHHELWSDYGQKVMSEGTVKTVLQNVQRLANRWSWWRAKCQPSVVSEGLA
jgi:hypothetical protein